MQSAGKFSLLYFSDTTLRCAGILAMMTGSLVNLNSTTPPITPVTRVYLIRQ